MKCERDIETKTIRELCELVVDCPHSTPTWTSQGKIVVRNNNIKNGRIDLSSPSYTDEEHYKQRTKRAVPRPGDIIITREAPIGEVGMIPDGVECCLGQRMVLLRPNPDICNNYYLLYSLQSRFVQHQISWSEGTGTTVSNLRIPHLEQIKIPYLPLEEQEKIASTLRVLDEKINLNRGINANLQQQAQAIFKSWFVDFEPFQDGEFVESELGPIPKGWSVGRLADICTYGKDKIAVSELTPENYFSTENMLANKGGHTSAASLPNVLQTTRCVPGDTLISNIRPYFKKIVYCTMKAGCSTDVLCLRPKHPKYSTYLYNLAYSDIFFDYMVAGSKGTKMPRGDKQQIMSYPVILPPDKVIAQFHEFADAALKKIRLASEENKKLTVLRDGLLPKLMSGELSINEEVGS